ncbi:hypothetical protein ACVWZ5_004073 [Pseudomonas sp. TE6283]
MNTCEYPLWHMIKTTKQNIPKWNDVATNCRLLRTPFNANTDFNQCNRDRRGTGEAAGRPAPKPRLSPATGSGQITTKTTTHPNADPIGCP